MIKKTIIIIMAIMVLAFDFDNQTDAEVFLNRIDFVHGYPRQDALTYCQYIFSDGIYTINNKVADVTDSIINLSKVIYISNAGDDNNVGDSLNPIKTIAELNTRLLPNTTIKFERGDTFVGEIQTNAGIYVDNVTIEPYGSGDNPRLSGGDNYSIPASDWDSIQTLINDSTFISIKTGDSVIIRTANYIFERIPVSTIINDTVILSRATDWELSEGQYYFFSNYSPNILGNAIKLSVTNNITIQNIDFRNYKIGININTGDSIFIKNCTFENMYEYAITGDNNEVVLIESCVIDSCHGNSINFDYATNLTISNNTIKNNSIIPGYSIYGTLANVGIMTDINCDTVLISNNIIDSVGYDGILTRSDNTIITNNDVSHYCMTKTDGGGIYMSSSTGANRIDSNYVYGQELPVLNTSYSPSVSGIYIDDYTDSLLCFDNTIVQNNNNASLVMSNANNIYSYSNDITGGRLLSSRYTVTGDYILRIYNNTVNSGDVIPLYIYNDFELDMVIDTNNYTYTSTYVANVWYVNKTASEWQADGYDLNSTFNE